jgi:ribosomal protein L11 methylase PrmA
MPTWLASRTGQGVYRPKSAADPDKARFILESLLGHARRVLRKVEPRRRHSTWSDYTTSATHYSPEQSRAKCDFLEGFLREHHPSSLLDVGCNTGQFSIMAAKSGARVVSIDSDPVVIGELWRAASAQRLDILPLTVNLSYPTPGLGWRNQEFTSFLERARGQFEAIFMLAVLHHMLVTDAIPLAEVLALAAALTTRFLVIEFVAPQDPMFQLLTRGREELHRYLTVEHFETACSAHFEVLGRAEGGTRCLYVLRRK